MSSDKKPVAKPVEKAPHKENAEEEEKGKKDEEEPPLCPRCEIPGHAEEDCEVPAMIFSMSKNIK